MILGTNKQGETSAYSYNALGVRVLNVQEQHNINYDFRNYIGLGSRYLKHDYLDIYKIDRNDWQPTWETGAGHIVQLETATYTKEYVVDYLSLANRDLMVYNEGEHIERHVYDRAFQRVSTNFAYAEDTARGEPGENIAGDTAVNHTEKLIYRTNHLTSTLFAVDEDGAVALHMMYDEWGNPQVDTDFNVNKSGVSNLNNYTGYTYDDVLGIYYAQNRFYDASTKRFIQEDPIKDGMNWYAYVGNNPVNKIDPTGLATRNPYEWITEDGFWSDIPKFGYYGVTYYSIEHVFQKIEGKSTKNISYAPISVDYSISSSGNVLLNTRNKNVGAASLSPISKDGRYYVDRAKLVEYFLVVWEGVSSRPGGTSNGSGAGRPGGTTPQPPTPDEHYQEKLGEEYVLISDWLKGFYNPTVGLQGRYVEIPAEGQHSSWYAYEGLSDIGNNAKRIIGDSNYAKQIYAGTNRENIDLYALIDKDERYWVAVGPMVMDPNWIEKHGSRRDVWAEDMNYGTKIDIVVERDNVLYYIPAVVGEAKAHTYPNGIYQTGVKFPGGSDFHPNNVDGSSVEFMGRGINGEMSKYEIRGIIVYE